MYTLNNIIVIIFNFIHAYAWGDTLVYIKSQDLEKIQLDFNWILNFALRVPSNF